MQKEQLLQELAEAFEQFISIVTDAERHGIVREGDTWGPREVAAHLAGWEVMASVRVPKIAAGMAPLEQEDEERQEVMDTAINATIVAMIGDQSLKEVCGILRQAYRRDIDILRKLDDRFFQPGEYVYERTKGAIEHCQEHLQELGLMRS